MHVLFNVVEPSAASCRTRSLSHPPNKLSRSVKCSDGPCKTTGRGEINNQAKNLTQALVDEHQAGLKIVNVQLLAVNPPSSVADAFRDVSSAREDRSTYINEAMAYRNEVIPSARGQAVGIIETARAEKTRKIDFAIGEAAGFESQLAAYLVAPGVTRTRLYLETLERVLPSVNKFIIDPTVRTDGTELWLTNPEATK
jgi:membrane protease subunit HflK